MVHKFYLYKKQDHLGNRNKMWRATEKLDATLLTTEYGRAAAEDRGAVALVLDLAKAFERVSFPFLWTLGDAHQLPKEDIAGAVRLFRAPAASAVRRMRGGAAQSITAILPGSKWSCLLSRIVLQDALSEVTKKSPVADITALMVIWKKSRVNAVRKKV